MSALTPHLKVLRAEAEALNFAAEHRHEAAHAIRSVEGMTVACLLQDLANAKLRAADALEAEERERLNATGLGPREMADEVEQLKSEHPLTSRQTEEGKP